MILKLLTLVLLLTAQVSGQSRGMRGPEFYVQSPPGEPSGTDASLQQWMVELIQNYTHHGEFHLPPHMKLPYPYGDIMARSKFPRIPDFQLKNKALLNQVVAGYLINIRRQYPWLWLAPPPGFRGHTETIPPGVDAFYKPYTLPGISQLVPSMSRPQINPKQDEALRVPELSTTNTQIFNSTTGATADSTELFTTKTKFRKVSETNTINNSQSSQNGVTSTQALTAHKVLSTSLLSKGRDNNPEVTTSFISLHYKHRDLPSIFQEFNLSSVPLVVSYDFDGQRLRVDGQNDEQPGEELIMMLEQNYFGRPDLQTPPPHNHIADISYKLVQDLIYQSTTSSTNLREGTSISRSSSQNAETTQDQPRISLLEAEKVNQPVDVSSTSGRVVLNSSVFPEYITIYPSFSPPDYPPSTSLSQPPVFPSLSGRFPPPFVFAGDNTLETRAGHAPVHKETFRRIPNPFGRPPNLPAPGVRSSNPPASSFNPYNILTTTSSTFFDPYYILTTKTSITTQPPSTPLRNITLIMMLNRRREAAPAVVDVPTKFKPDVHANVPATLSPEALRPRMDVFTGARTQQQRFKPAAFGSLLPYPYLVYPNPDLQNKLLVRNSDP